MVSTPADSAGAQAARRGRPTDATKRAAILQAARDEMIASGFEAASIEAIAAEAGVSKATVYRQFADKTGLLVAIVDQESDRLLARINALSTGKGGLPAKLVAFGEAMLDLVANPDHRAMEAVIERELPRHPDLGKRFYDSGPARLLATLTRLLAEAAAAGEIRAPDPETSAGHLIALLLGFDAVRRRLLPEAPESPTARAARLVQAVDLFLAAHSFAAPDH